MVVKYIKSNICHIPWTGLETRPDGSYRPCCIYKEEIKQQDGSVMNTKEHSVEEAQKSKYMEDLRNEFRTGGRPTGCENCWKEEDSGKTSKRQHAWIKSPQIGQVAVENNKVSPQYIDLKLGNICNLKCRICTPQSSSQWVPEWVKMDPQNKEHWLSYNRKGLWPRQQNRFLAEAEDWLPHVRYFEITGGEPLMIQEQFEVLRKCVDMGVAHKIDVHYNTNGTQYPEHAVKDIWPHFKRVELAYSIDDIGSRFEYQRKNANWDTVNENIKKFRDSGLPNLSTQVCTTINFFNIMYIDELAHAVKDWTPDFWHINILHGPIEFDVQQLASDTKRKITEKLKKCNLYKEEIQTAINYLNQEPLRPQDVVKMRMLKVKQIDKLRNENFKHVFPDLNNLVRIYE